MIIKNTKARVIFINGIKLVPGANILKSHQEAQLFGDEVGKNHVKERVENGTFEILDAQLDAVDAEEVEDIANDPQEALQDITELSARKAVALIKDTMDVETLEAFRNQEEANEERASVVKAIDKQLDKIDAASYNEEDE